MQKYNVIALHGFLGEASDWDAVRKFTPDNYNWVGIELFKKSGIAQESLVSLSAVANEVARSIEEGKRNNIFIGYSLGARIGLHLLERYSDFFEKFIFVSCHPGLLGFNDKNERRKNDDIWLEKLKNCLNIQEFWNLWVQQSVFQGDHILVRDFTDYSKDKLFAGLGCLSLAEQKDMRSLIETNQNKITWIVGDRDEKFCALAEDLKQKKILSGYERIFNSGHRVLFDQPSVLADVILKQ